jgi:hypothetical protein
MPYAVTNGALQPVRELRGDEPFWSLFQLLLGHHRGKPEPLNNDMPASQLLD